MYQFLYIYVKSKAIKRENFMNLLDLDSMYNSNKIRFEIPRKLLIIIVWFLEKSPFAIVQFADVAEKKKSYFGCEKC